MTTTVPPDTHTAFADDDVEPDRNSSLFRAAPSDIPAEQAVLGAMLLAKYAIDDCADIVTPGDFYYPKHGVVFEAIVHLHWNQQPADPITVADYLDRKGELSKVGGQAYLHHLVSCIPTAANGSYYAGIVADQAVLRRLVEAGTRIVQMGYAEGGGTVDDLVGAAQSEVDGVARGQVVDVVQLGSKIDEILASTHEERQTLSTPWPSVNRILQGFEKGRVYTVGARPGGGKSILMLQACLWVAMKHQLPAAITSLEMNETELGLRAIALLSGVDLTIIKDPKSQTEFQRGRIREAANTFRRLPIFVDDRADQTVEMMRTHARQVKQRCGKLGIIGIDYAQLFEPSRGRKFGTRQEEVAHISRQTKMTAKALEVPTILLAQLNNRDGSKPTLGSLRESGSLEQDSDAVILLHRDEDPDTGEKSDELLGVVAKHRSGPTGGFSLHFDGARMRFTEHDDEPANRV